MKTLVTALALLALTGCATCERHPTACTVVAFVAAGAVLIAAGSHDNSGTKGNPPPANFPLTYPGVKPVNCTELDCR